MDMEFKRAGMGELDTVTDMLQKLYGDHHERKELLEENKAHIENPAQAFFLAYQGDNPVGVAHVSIRQEYVEGSHNEVCGYLEAIYTEPTRRRQGVARQLVAECERWASQNGCTLFASDCELDNEGSLHFHLGVGFREVSRNIHFAKPLP